MGGPPELRERLADPRPLLLDGATGTELERRGARAGLPLWSAHALIDQPELVAAIHADYVAAGAELLTTNTFRTQRRTLARAERADEAAGLCAVATRLARRAARSANRPVWVLGSAPPLEDCFRPDLVPAADPLAREHAEHAANLAAAGVDAILVETMNTVREALSAVRAARATGLEVVVSFVCERGARLVSGEPLGEALDAVAGLDPVAVAVNCLAPSQIEACLPVLAACGLPFGVYPNLGPPGEGGAPWSEELAPEELATQAEDWLAAGARLVGGCCGTTPAHVRALAARVHPG